jgi:diguanylate cyclase (GGDEF)-like protein
VAQRGDKLLAICYLDLDGFKPVNDRLGHAAGDQLLREIARRLKEGLRGGDTVARLGGDEFVLLLGDLSGLDELEPALARLLAAISQPIVIDRHEASVSGSIGVTLFPLDGSDPDTLLRHADQAMYLAKQAGRNRYHLFDVRQDARAKNHRETRQRLELALAERRFELHYQPKVNMRSGTIVGVEALLRLREADGSLTLPGEFLPQIEDQDIIVTIGDWTLSEALRQMRVWAEDGLVMTVSVNIAARHLMQAGFVERLEELLAGQPTLGPRQLELEILETTALADMDAVNAIIRRCKHIGIKIALDDFGTGYSSLTYFRRLPTDTLKIDQSFIRDMLEDPEDMSIVEGVVGLTSAFGRTAIAEGVETSQHGIMLLHLGCDLGQGFGIAPPMPGGEIPDWTARFAPDPAWAASLAQKWKREDFPLFAAEIEHQRWIAELQRILDSTRPLPLPLPPTSAHDCRFGQWYDNAGRRRYGSLPGFAALAPLHDEVHRCGVAALAAHNAGDKAAVRDLANALQESSQRLLGALATLRADLAANDPGPRHAAH